jgi:hypothetical protein
LGRPRTVLAVLLNMLRGYFGLPEFSLELVVLGMEGFGL